MVTVAAMQAHAEAICNRRGIAWDCADWHKPQAITEWAVIETPPIRGARSYAAVMHDIGYRLSGHQKSPEQRVAAQAHFWPAKKRWIPQMKRSALAALNRYRHRLKTGLTRTERNDGWNPAGGPKV